MKQHKFVGREFELSQLDALVKADSAEVFVLQAEDGLGKTSFLHAVSEKYTEKPQLFLDAKNLPVIRTATEFLLYFASKAKGFEKFIQTAKKIHEEYRNPQDFESFYQDVYAPYMPNPQPKHDRFELVLLNALAKDCSRQPLILIDNFEVLSKNHLVEAKIACHYSDVSKHVDKSLKYHPESINLKAWLLGLFEFLHQKGALLILTSLEDPDSLDSKELHLKRFSQKDILSFLQQTDFFSLQPLIKEHKAAVIEILTQLSAGGEVLWLRLAIHYLTMELEQGKKIASLISLDNLKISFIKNITIYKKLGHDEDDAYKLALLKAVLPPDHNKEWLIALPRCLDDRLLNVIFAGHADVLRYSFLKNGLLREKKLGQQLTYTLHPEIKRLFLTLGMPKLKSNEICTLYRTFADIYRQYYQQTKDEQLLVDEYYYRVMAGDEKYLKTITEPLYLVAIATQLENERQYERLHHVLLRISEISPEYGDIWHGIGVCLAKQGKLDEAVLAYQKQLVIKPEHDLAWQSLGFVLNQQGKVEEAVAAYQKTLSLEHSEEQNPHVDSLEEKKLKRMVAYYQEQLKLCFEHHTAWFNMGMALKKLGDLEETVKALRKHLSVNPEDQIGWNNLGTTLYHQLKLEESEHAFAKALKIKPKYLYALINDSELALIQNDNARCEKNLKQASTIVNKQMEDYAILPFLSWLNNPESSSPKKILEAIEELDLNNNPPCWCCKDIEPVLNRLNSKQKKIARIFAAYFNREKDLDQLRDALDDTHIFEADELSF